MQTRTAMRLSAAIEITTGVVLIASPELVAHLLLGIELSTGGTAVARLTGGGLLSLGLACWPSGDEPVEQATRALFVYNLLARIYLGYLRVGG